MNREIACALIDEELGRLRNFSYAELLKMMDKPSTINVQGPDDKRYQIERQVFWDSKKGGNIRVMVSADDGGWSAFKPLSGAFIISPDSSFIGDRP
jgi:hypothetical protein